MKKNILLATALAAVCGFTSCGDVLDIYPVENNTANQFYKTEYEMNQAVMGMYARLGRNSTNTDYPTDMYYQASEGRSDNLYYATMANAQRDQVDMRNYQCTDNTSLNTSIYGRLWTIITDTNTLLAKSAETYTRFRAEAKFMRALAYFDLVRAYGPQPIVNRVISAKEARSFERKPIAEVYQFIINDLTDAAANLEPFYTGDEAGRVGSVATKCLLGYVYVTMAGYPLNDTQAYAKAVETLAPIMPDVKKRFAPNFADVFSLKNENKYDLFSVQFSSGGKGLGSSLPAFITSSGGKTTCFPEWAYYPQQGQDFRVDTLLVNDMVAAGDKRMCSIAQGYWTTTKHGYTRQDTLSSYDDRCIIVKFLVKDNTTTTIKEWNDYPLNFPMLRPADAYLLYAEALVATNHAEEAKPWLNAIRERAGLPDIANPTMTDIMRERRVEFLGEGKRYFDLVRMGKDTFVSTLKAFSDHYQHVTVMNASDPTVKDMLLPIPLSVTSIHTSWKNNDGY